MANKLKFEARGYRTGLSEEVVRWSFELASTTAGTRFVAFTNPTAGPWKLVKATAGADVYELHRFGRDDERPDVILVCDDLKLILVLEAKEHVEQLDAGTIEKTYEIARFFATHFAGFDKHEAWEPRRCFNVRPGFLFGAPSPASALEHVVLLRARVKTQLPSDFEPYICAVTGNNGNVQLIEDPTGLALLGQQA